MKRVGMYGGKFLPVHMGHVHAMVTASTLVDELHVVVSYDEEHEKGYFENGRMEPISFQQRLRWWSEITSSMDHVFVHAIHEKQTGAFSDWEAGAEKIKKAVRKKIDVVFSSEESYGPIFGKLYPDAEHYIIDKDRDAFPISATQIREDGAHAHWDMIPEVVRPYFVKKVVIVGTESCGKSTIVQNLARIFNTTYVEEYGRTYYDKFKDCVSITLESDYTEIAYGQKWLEKKELEKANKVLFIDTEAVVTQYYSELYVNKNQEVLSHVANLQDYDLYLYLEPDVVWVDDGTRAHGDQEIREENNIRLKQLFDEHGIEYVCIGGSYYERLQKCKQLVEELFKAPVSTMRLPCFVD